MLVTRMLTRHMAKLGYTGICTSLGITHDFSSKTPLKLPSSCIISSLASRPLQTPSPSGQPHHCLFY